MSESPVKIDNQMAAKGDAENAVNPELKEQAGEQVEKQPDVSMENGTSAEMKSNGQTASAESAEEVEDSIPPEAKGEAAVDEAPAAESHSAVTQSNADNVDPTPSSEPKIDSDSKVDSGNAEEPEANNISTEGEGRSSPDEAPPTADTAEPKAEEEQVSTVSAEPEKMDTAPEVEQTDTENKTEEVSAEKTADDSNSQEAVKEDTEEMKETTEENADEVKENTEEVKENTEEMKENTEEMKEDTEEAAKEDADAETPEEPTQKESPTDAPEAEESKSEAVEAPKTETEEEPKPETEDVVEEKDETKEVSESSTPGRKKRGRPAKSASTTPKSARRGRAPKVTQAEEKGEAEAGEEPMETEEAAEIESTTPQLGLLERPVEIQTGKRNRRKVDRLSENISATPATAQDKKKFTIPEGRGVRLGDCPAIEEVISKTKAEELKIFHKFLYGTPGKSPNEIKKNVRGFCGWEFTIDDGEYKKKAQAINKINLPVLKSWCGMLKLTVGGSKDSLVDRLMSYLIEPTAVKQSQAKATDTGKRKRGAKSKVEDSDAEEEQTDQSAEEKDSEDSADEEDKPAAKRRKTATKKSPARKTPARSKAKETPKSTGRGRGRKSATASSVVVESQGPPTDEIIRQQIEKILQTADLEVVTMKTVRQQILDMYSDFDLSGKKEFIKSTVKEILGA